MTAPLLLPIITSNNKKITMPHVRAGHAVIKVSFPDERLQDLKLLCRVKGTTMSDFLRETAINAMSAPASLSALPQGPDIYSRAVQAAARVAGGVSRVQIEAVTAAVINSLYASTSTPS